MSLFGAMGIFGGDDDPFAMMGGRGGMMGSPMMSMMMRDPFGQDPFFNGGQMRPALMGRQGPPSNIDPYMSPFSAIMSSMNGSQDGNCHTFSSSSVMSMTTGPDGRPQVYQASSSSRSAPGGVQETRQSVADSRTGMRKMAIGHHLDERSHVVEKQMSRDGDLEETQEFVNLDESDAGSFDAEYRRRAQHVYGGRAIDYTPRPHNAHVSPTHARTTYLPALPSSTSYRRRQRQTPAVTSASSRHDDRRHRERTHRHNRNA